ncbi:MAG: carboxypeptidase-like regulatory domain-containing protein [Nocardioides sp.]|nr:carboxypeptidase-like regulatory domain-containing protein [Nocardioides sp.]
MRRLLALIAAASLALMTLAAVAGPPAAVAADPLTGRLVDATGAHPAVQGATVRLRTVTASGPGAVVDTDVTGSDGRFALDAGASPDDEYYVQVVPGVYQGGYVGGGWVQPNPGYAVTYDPHASIGRILANPAFIRGVLVNSANGKRVAGVKVTARSANHILQVEGSDYTGRAGVFRINGLECEDDCYLKVHGRPQGYEVGFRGCSAQVVPTWGAACASPIGRIGRVFLDRL